VFESIVKWTMVGLMAFSALMTVGAVGKQRKPLTGGTAAGVVLVNAVWITAIVAFWD
jgi:hypothetical protein